MKTIKLFKTVASIAVLSAVTSTAWATGTAAGTDIDNTASISYSVSGTAQTDIYSSPLGNSTPGVPGSGGGAPTVAATTTTFKVDKKIDLTVTAIAPGGTVTPNATNQALTYTLLNEGNSQEYFSFSVTDNIATDDFDPSTCDIPSEVQLNADTSTTITILCDIPSNANNTETSDVDLKATAIDGSGGSAYVESAADTTGVDIVLADDKGSATDTGSETAGAPAGERNASHSAVNTFTVAGAAASLTVQKTSIVIEDPVNGTLAGGNFPKRIPGAIIEYTITVSNADGASDATGLVITDDLSAELANLTLGSCTASGDAVDGAGAAVTPTCTNAAGVFTTSAFTLKGGTGGSAQVETLTILATVQ